MDESCKPLDIGCWLSWLAAEFKAFFIWLWKQLLLGLAELIAWIPVPEFLQDIPTFNFPPAVLYWANLFMVPQGMGIVVSAYILRFIIRRIPVIG